MKLMKNFKVLKRNILKFKQVTEIVYIVSPN